MTTNTYKYRFSFILVFALILSVAFFFKPSETLGASKTIYDNSKTETATKSTTIDSAYTFVPKFTSKTKVITFGADGYWKKKSVSAANSTKVWSLVVDGHNDWKGKVGVRYTHVGSYNGQELDLVMTLTDWTAYFNNPSNISFGTTEISTRTQGYTPVKLSWKFVKTGTDTAVKVSGYMTMTDVDAYQGIKFSKTTTSAIQSYLVANKTNKIKWSQTNGEDYFFDTSGIDTLVTSDDNYQFTFLFKNLSTITVSYYNDYELQGRYAWNFDDTSYGGGKYFTYNAEKPAKTKVATPKKYIYVDKEQVGSNTLDSYKDKVTYQVVHTVPDEDKKFYYSSYKMVDTFPKGLTYNSLKIKSSDGTDVTSWFTVSTSGQKVTATAKSAKLKSADFYGDMYTFTYTTTPKLADLKTLDTSSTSVTLKNTATATVSGTDYKTNTTSTKLNRRTVTVEHINKTTGKTLKTVKETKFDGETYSYSPLTNLTYTVEGTTLNYNPTSTAKQEGTINGKNVSLKFYYEGVDAIVGMKKIEVFTDLATKGLPVEMAFTVKEQNADYGSDKITLNMKDKASSDVVYTKAYTLTQLEKGISFTIPSTYLAKNKNYDYTLSFTGYDNKQIVLSQNAKTIEIKGYTSSQKTLSQDLTSTTDDLTYKGVVKTEREIGKDMVTYYEEVVVPNSRLDKTKTGFGVEMDKKITYSNDLSDLSKFNPTSQTLVDSKLIDSYLTYTVENGKAKIDMQSTTNSIDSKKSEMELELPQVYVEKKTGYLFSKEQKEANDSRIKNALVDGKDKLYIPIWLDNLGNYDVNFKTTAFGVNQVTVSLSDKLNVYAYMYATINSDTLEDDEFLVEPVDTQKPFNGGLPIGWTTSDIEWLKQ